MNRNFVKVARIRIEDIRIGDVVNRDPESETGWFEVHETQILFNGDLQLVDRTELVTISGPYFSLVGVQFVSSAAVPEQPPSPLPPMESDDDLSAEAEQPAAPVEDATPAALVG